MAWVKEPPYVPEAGFASVYYWYYDIQENEIWPVEIYHGCWKLHGYDGLWWDERITPPDKPSLEKPKDEKGDCKRRTRRNRTNDTKKSKKSS